MEQDSEDRAHSVRSTENSEVQDSVPDKSETFTIIEAPVTPEGESHSGENEDVGHQILSSMKDTGLIRAEVPTEVKGFDHHVLSSMKDTGLNRAEVPTEVEGFDHHVLSSMKDTGLNRAEVPTEVKGFDHHVLSSMKDTGLIRTEAITEVEDFGHHVLSDMKEKEIGLNRAEVPTDIEDNAEISVSKPRGETELKIMEAFHITSALTRKPEIENNLVENNISEGLEDIAGFKVHINHCTDEAADGIDALSDEIQAELTVHAEYHNLKSTSTSGHSDLDQFYINDSRNPEGFKSSTNISKTIKKEIHENEHEQNEDERSGILINEATYFGSESSSFLVSDASRNLDQLTQDHVVEELTTSNELSELGVDDSYLDGFTGVKEELVAQCHSTKPEQLSTNKTCHQIKNVKNSAETTLLDSSSISKIKSLWAKICTVPKAPNSAENSPRKRGRPKSSGSSVKNTVQSISEVSVNIHDDGGQTKNKTNENSPKKRGRPKGSGSAQNRNIQSFSKVSGNIPDDGGQTENKTNENSPKKRGRPKGSGSAQRENIQSIREVSGNSHDDGGQTKNETNENSPRKRGRPKGSGSNIQSFSEVLGNIHDDGGQIENKTNETSPRKRGRPKGSGSAQNRNIQSFSEVSGNIPDDGGQTENKTNENSPKKRGRPKGSGTNIQSFRDVLGNIHDDGGQTKNKTNTKSNKGVMGKQNGILSSMGKKTMATCKEQQKTVTKMPNFIEVNHVNMMTDNVTDSNLLNRYNILPCEVKMQRLDDQQPLNKKAQSEVNIHKTTGKAKVKDQSKAELLKEEKNSALYEMNLKLEHCIPELTFDEDFEDFEADDGKDEINASDDEYTPTNNPSLKTAFVKSSKIKRGYNSAKSYYVKRKIDFVETKERPVKRARKRGTCRIGAPPKFGHFECKKCEFTANEKNLVEKHYKREHARPWLDCHYCDQKFKVRDCLLEHEAKLHTKGKPFKCSVDGCLYASSNRSDLSRHQAKHATVKIHKCPKCDYITKWKKNVGHHIMLVHTTERRFKCSICSFACKRNHDLKQHMFRHTDEKPITCLTCGFKVKTNWELRSHMLSHSNVRPYKCTYEGCQAAAKTNSDLLKHIRQVHWEERNFTCTLCNKGYKDQRSLNKHHSYVHVTTRLFKCDICNKGFKCKPALKKHILFHEGFKPHKCPVCTKRFACKNGMNKHMKTHDFKFRPYRCPLCPYGARQPDHLLGHIGSFHGDTYCYFCELCNKPFRRYGMLRFHYQRMHKSEIPQHNNGDQIDLALVKMEMELQEDNSKRKKVKKVKRKPPIAVAVQIKEEQIDDGYETVQDTVGGGIDNTDESNNHGRDDVIQDTDPSILKPQDQANKGDEPETFHSTNENTFQTLSDIPEEEDQLVNGEKDLTQIKPKHPNNLAVHGQDQGNDKDLDEAEKIAEFVENKNGIAAEAEKMSELVVNRNGTATLAIYNSLRLSLATKGFSFNYEKTGKKPKAWFMDVDCMSPRDANKQKIYLRKAESRSRRKAKLNNLTTFLKQRTENRNRTIRKSKLMKSVDEIGIPKRGRPCKTELKIEDYEPKRGQARQVKFKGKYSEIDDEEYEWSFPETDMENGSKPSTMKSESSVYITKTPNTCITDTDTGIVTTQKRKRGRPKKVNQVSPSVVENVVDESHANKPANTSKINNEPNVAKGSKPKGKMTHKRKLDKEKLEQESNKPKWQRKYIPVRMRKQNLKKKDLVHTVKKTNASKVKPAVRESKSHSDLSLKVKTTGTQCDTLDESEEDDDLHDVSKDEVGGTTEQDIDHNSTKATESFVVPEITNFCDDVLAMQSYKHIDTLLGDNVKVSEFLSERSKQPDMPSGADDADVDNCRVNTNYLNYKIYLNVPGSPSGSVDDDEGIPNGSVDGVPGSPNDAGLEVNDDTETQTDEETGNVMSETFETLDESSIEIKTESNIKSEIQNISIKS